MNIEHGTERYWTVFFEDRQGGCAGYRMHRQRFGKSAIVAETIFWDSTGGFVFKTIDGEDIPVEVVEAAIAESRKKIKVS